MCVYICKICMLCIPFEGDGFNFSVCNSFLVLGTSTVCDNIHHTRHAVCTSNHVLGAALKQLTRVAASINMHKFGTGSAIRRWMQRQPRPDHCRRPLRMTHLRNKWCEIKLIAKLNQFKLPCAGMITNFYSLSLSQMTIDRDLWDAVFIPDRLLPNGTIDSYSPSQISANDSVNTWPQNRFVDKSIAIVDVKHSEISKQSRIRAIMDL